MRSSLSLLLPFALLGMVACGGGDAAPPPASPPPAPAPAPPPALVPPPPPAPVTDRPARFSDDVEYLARHAPVHVLEAGAGLGGRVVVSARYQGRVMTSAVEPDGASFGWVNRAFIDAGKTGTQFDNFGGEDRFWLGPEGGQFGLYFPTGKPFSFDLWQVPSAMQEGEWEMTSLSPTSVRFKRSMVVPNWTGTLFTVQVERTVSIVDAKAPEGVKAIAYETVNKITNAGKTAWKRETGLPSIWVLGQFAPSADARVIIPFDPTAKGPIVNDAYFGKVPADRLAVREDKGFLVFTCDGQQRGKIGLGPARAKPSLGSYSARDRLLTVVEYDKSKVANAPYVNSMWEQQKQPFAGDVINSYNDGPTAPGKPALGGFYEIETSSPGAELAPGASIAHTHRTFHFVGERAGLEGLAGLASLAKKMLGVDLADVR